MSRRPSPAGPRPVATREAILAMWWHAVLPGQLPPSDAVRRRAARRWAAQDRARGYRILPPDPPATGRPWANALPKE